MVIVAHKMYVECIEKETAKETVLYAVKKEPIELLYAIHATSYSKKQKRKITYLALDGGLKIDSNTFKMIQALRL